MSKLLRNLLAPAAFVLLTTACATGSASSTFKSDAVRADAPLTIQVRNNNWSDAVIWAVQGGRRIRLGEVVSHQEKTLKVPRSALTGTGRIRLLVSLIGSRERFVTEDLYVDPGSVIDLQLQNHLAISSWSVYRP